jgi:hypothetical protein
MNPLIESFNARNYTPAQVAATFIPNDDYHLLWRNEHTVVLGPRGSGKTTLFKMLTVQALYAWHSADAERLRVDRPFTAIYVPTDMHWHHQLKHAEDLLNTAPEFSAAASRAAVTTSVLLGVTRTFNDRLTAELRDSSARLTELCSLLIANWLLPKTLPTLDMINLALKARIGEIRRLVNRAILARRGDSHTTVPDYFDLDYFAALDYACSAFDTIFNLGDACKWAICFDELELAPTWLQELALSQQRSSEDTYLIKVSTSPLPSTLGTTEAQPKQDVRLISIWNYSGCRADDFSERLASSVIERRLGRKISPKELFGSSELPTDEATNVAKYTRGSAEWTLLRDLATWDVGLKELLQRYKIDPTNPITSDAHLRDTLLRKIKPVAVLRHAFLKPRTTGSGGVVLRTRKLSTVYHGCEAIYRICDGNPRRLIGIVDDLCARLTASSVTQQDRLSQNEQAEVLTRASKHFLGYIHALPGGIAQWGENYLDLVTVLKAIATSFRQELLGREFPLDPHGSFIVDPNVDDKLIALLRLGVYHGAIVYVDPIPDTIETSLRGKRFRLSYMLAPGQRLPLTLYDPKSLSSILRNSPRLRVRRVLPMAISAQMGLPLESHP